MSPPKLKDLDFHERLGKGASGVVYRATRKKDGRELAVKEIDLGGMEIEEKEDCVRKMLGEVQALASMESPFIIKYYGSFMYDDRMFIVTEYAANGDLHGFLKRQTRPLEEKVIWKMLLQATMGLNHIHSKRILHRDVKSPNIFLDADLNIKIGDMGISKVMGSMTNMANTLVGTPYYLSPELCEGQSYNEKADMWALGIVLYECCTCGTKPFEGDSLGSLVCQILEGKYPSITGYSEDLVAMIDGMMMYSVEDRFDTGAVLSSPVVQAKAVELGVDLMQTAGNISLESYMWQMSLAAAGQHQQHQLAEAGGEAPPDVVEFYGDGANLGGVKGTRKVHARGAHGRMRRPMRASSRASSEGQATSVEAEDSNAAQGIVADASDERDGGGLSPVGAILQSTLSVSAESRDSLPDSGTSAEARPEKEATHARLSMSTIGVSDGSQSRPEGLPDTALGRAVYFAQQAVSQDGAGDFESAFRLYQKALEYFETAVKKAEKGRVKEVLMKKMVAYLERAEYLKQVLSTRDLYREVAARPTSARARR